MKHTSGNRVNIQINLCVHPNIISKGTKAWIKRSLRVITWLGYKRKDISGTIGFKWPSIREHSFYLHSKDKFTSIPLLLNTNFGVKTWYTVILTTYSSFGFFFLFLCFSFSCTHSFLFFFYFYVQYNVVLITQIKIPPIYLTSDLHLPFLPNLNKNIPYLNVPLLYAQGTSKQWRFRVQSNKKNIRVL